MQKPCFWDARTILKQPDRLDLKQKTQFQKLGSSSSKEHKKKRLEPRCFSSKRRRRMMKKEGAN